MGFSSRSVFKFTRGASVAWALGITIFCAILLGVGPGPQAIEKEGAFINRMVEAVGFSALVFAILVWVIRHFWRSSVREFGWRAPENIRGALLLFAIFQIGAFPFVFFFSSDASIVAYNGIFMTSVFAGAVYLIAAAAYFLVEEFVFRGFLFFALKKSVGRFAGYFFNIGLFTLFHIGKPTAELIIVPFLALALCYTAEKTKSVFVPAALHYGIALLTNLLIFLR